MSLSVSILYDGSYLQLQNNPIHKPFNAIAMDIMPIEWNIAMDTQCKSKNNKKSMKINNFSVHFHR